MTILKPNLSSTRHSYNATLDVCFYTSVIPIWFASYIEAWKYFASEWKTCNAQWKFLLKMTHAHLWSRFWNVKGFFIVTYFKLSAIYLIVWFLGISTLQLITFVTVFIYASSNIRHINIFHYTREISGDDWKSLDRCLASKSNCDTYQFSRQVQEWSRT